MMASPSNPTGTSIPFDELTAICDLARSRDAWRIVDEIYLDLADPAADGTPPRSALSIDPDAIVINSFSKYFGMTGWRLGWAVLPEALAEPSSGSACTTSCAPPHPPSRRRSRPSRPSRSRSARSAAPSSPPAARSCWTGSSASACPCPRRRTARSTSTSTWPAPASAPGSSATARSTRRTSRSRPARTSAPTAATRTCACPTPPPAPSCRKASSASAPSCSR